MSAAFSYTVVHCKLFPIQWTTTEMVYYTVFTTVRLYSGISWEIFLMYTFDDGLGRI